MSKCSRQWVLAFGGWHARSHRSRKAARKVAELEAARSKVLALRRWLDDGRYAPAKSRSPSVDLRKPSGEQYAVDEVLPLIEAALAPPGDRPKPESAVAEGHGVRYQNACEPLPEHLFG